jgi:hypothetical protein
LKRVPRRAIPWTALALVTSMAAGGAVFGIVEASSSTPGTVSRQSLPSHPPTSTTLPPAAPLSVAPPGPPDPPPPGPLTVNGPGWAGHGDLAFVSSGQLEVLSNAGSLTTITGPSGGGFDSNPAWSPDEQWLAFLHTGPANGFELPAPTLWLVEAGSSQAEEVTTTGVGMFAWSPTAPLLAYTTVPTYNFPGGVPEDLWFERPGAPPTSVAVGTGAGLGAIAWSPDGSELAFDESVFPQPASATSPATPATGQLGIVSVNGGQVAMVYLLAESGIDLAGWWPEGGGLLFWEDTGFSASIEEDGLTLYSLEFGSEQPVALTTSLVGSTWLAPQPGGSTVAVVSGGGRTIWTTGRDIDLCRFPTATCQSVSIPAGTVGLAPSWSPSGALIFSLAAAAGPFSTTGTADFSPGWMAQWNATSALWAMVPGEPPSPMTSTPAGSLLAVPNAHGSTMVVVADNDLWLTDTSGPSAVRVAGPLYSTIGPSGFYGEVDWASTFAWSTGAGLRQGSTQLDEIPLLSDEELP